MNSEQRKHLVRSLQTIALGQLVFFGYKPLDGRRFALVLQLYLSHPALVRCI
ncbi:MAG: hypothetical protein JO189_19930 [Deltaproteobacteria bacterium]|nr:hypothetical protein [Deltaproteobacteria bacterium]